MKFSNSMIAQAVGSVLALAAGSQAFAVDISNYNEATQITLNIGGATATRPGLLNLFKLNVANNGICADGTLDLYHSADKFLMLCTGRATGSPALPAALQNARIAVQKSDTGGSGNGVAPLVRPSLGAALPDFMNIPTGGGFLLTQCAAGVVNAATGSFASWTDHTCTDNQVGNVVDKVPDAGISDLEPAIFKTAFSPPLTNAELAAIPAGSISAVIFGIPVTLVTRNNMQRVQFPTGNVCNPANAAYAANAETEACMPSLTKGQLAALYTQNYLDWTNFVGPNGDSVAAPTGGTALASSGEVFICRRVSTSGTQAVFETQLLGQRCALGVPAFASIATDALGGHVFEGSGSGDVVNCLKTQNTANHGAIGVLSMEFAPTIGGVNESGYRFLKMNGVAPCLLNIVESKYDFLGESTMQWRTASIAGLTPLSGNPLTLANAVRDRVGSPAVVNDLNTSANFQHGFCTGAGLGTGALMGNALSNSATAPVPPFVTTGGGVSDVVAHPILTKTRGINGANSCGALIDILPTQQVN